MTLTLHVDGPRWRDHLVAVAERTPGMVPVAKGNGYGFGLPRLARRTQWLADRGAAAGHTWGDVLAVGTYDEIGEVASRYDGSILVLTPWRPFGAALDVDPALAHRVIHTVSRAEDLATLLERQPDARYVLELVTSMLRHGMTGRELRGLGGLTARGTLEGVAMHLPLAQGSHLSQVQRLVTDAIAADLPTRTLWVSHLTRSELDRLRTSYSDFTIRPRIGTDLWLGDRGALKVTAQVLDVHAVERGDVFGYRSRTAPKSGHVLVVSGGTAHGIGLEAPSGDQSLKARAATLARGGLDAVGFVRSPYSIGGKQRLFAEPPHMQASMLFLPHGSQVPQVGDEIDVRVRFTATAFDRVEVS
ncbi:alanine racemase [Nocardioides daphniae]|uniref:Alanine racemase n=1 Tax=Nocardioides daphniae TaxID=402297 RepID=A0A4P7UE17_9ACTN|nr:alanine racemase [Nocardioides daphniae]QCC78523.1 alanine racemase [Nocardioides daphniae]